MSLVVQKFGGTSLGDAEKIHRAARRAARGRINGRRVVVVVSAMSQTTDDLIDLAYQVTDRPSRREMDQLLATGEQVSIALMAMAIHHAGHDAISLTGGQIGLRTDQAFGRARIKEITQLGRIRTLLDGGSIVIVAGFQGVDESLNITTLGRGGSDTSAVAIAAALEARCEIYSDVDGIYTTDPRIVPEAHKLARVSYEEMLELASLGAKVLQTRSVELAMVYGVQLRVRSSFEAADAQADGDGEPGTLVCDEEDIVEQQVVSGITYSKDEAQISLRRVKDKPGVSAAIFGPLAEADNGVDMIVQNVSADGETANLTFTLATKDLPRALEVLEAASDKIGFGELTHATGVAKVSVIGIGMRSHTGVASRMFKALAEKGINIQLITTSEIKISVLIDAAYTELAVRVLHSAYDLDKA